MTVNFQSLRAILLAAARRHAHGDHGWACFPVADAGRRSGRPLDRRADRGLACGVSLPPEGRQGLLLDAGAQPLPAALRCRFACGPDCSLTRDEPADGIAAARAYFQGSRSGGASSHGRSIPRQTVTTLCWTHCRVRPEPSRRQPTTIPSTSSNGLSACVFRRWHCTISSRGTASIAPVARPHSTPTTRQRRPNRKARYRRRGSPAEPPAAVPPRQPVPLPAPPFSSRRRSTRARSS